MKHILLSILLLLFLTSETHARKYGLIGRRINSTGSIILSGGPNYCFGDTYGSPYSKSMLDGTNWESGIGFRQIFDSNIGYKANLLFGNYSGSDGTNPRNYSSQTNTIELSVRGEYTYYFGGSDRYRTPNHHSIYGFLGFGIANCNVIFPSTSSVADPLATATKNKFVAPIIPIGIGYTYSINDDFSVGAEVCWKVGLSDYIDGFHPVPYSKKNDVIGGFTVTLAYKLFGSKSFLDR